MEQDDAYAKLGELVGQNLLQIAHEKGVTVQKRAANGQITINKGWPGHAVERFLGLPLNSSKSPNLGSWELKVVPIIERSCGTLVPKETMAITMLDPCEVAAKEFKDAHVYTKLSKLIIVSRLVYQNNLNSKVLGRTRFRLSNSIHFAQIAADYEDIRQTILSGNKLTGRIGKLMQPRTKGPKNSTSRAFYARKELVTFMVKPELFVSVR